MNNKFRKIVRAYVREELNEATSTSVNDQSELEDARELDEYFEKGVLKNDLDFLLWRGMEKVSIETWKWFQMHGLPDRSHMYFKNTTKELVNQLENVYPEDVPERFHSAWCSPSKDKARDFGDPHVCFLKKNSGSVCWEKDSVNYFHLVDSYLMGFARDIVSNQKIKKQNPKLYKFGWALKNMKETNFEDGKIDTQWIGKRGRHAAKIILNDTEYLKKMFWKYKDKPMPSGKYDNLAESYVKMVEDLNNYFEDMKRNITEDCLDIMFENGPYILAEEEFFKEYFHWNGSEWRLKSKYQDQDDY